MALVSPPSTPRAVDDLAVDPPSTSFDIAGHYTHLIQNDPSLTPAIAAIELLIALLSSNPLTTISETLALAAQQSNILLASQRNPIPLSAGTDLFQRYLVSSFQQRSLAQSDFSSLRNHLISTSKLFVSRANQAPKKIAQHALPFIREDSTIFTSGSSSIIEKALSNAIDTDRYFTLITITSPTSPSPTLQCTAIPTSTIPIHALTYTLSSLTPQQRTATSFILPATAVLENGATISPLGTHQLALLASSFSIPVYIAVESYNFVRSFPLGSGAAELSRLGVSQDLLKLNGAEQKSSNGAAMSGKTDSKAITDETEMIEIVPPHLITALITENGIMTPADVSEELIKLWF